jgi:hypothetical protein
VSARKSSLKFDWERALAATRYRKDVKAIGRAVACHAWADGSHAHPGVETLMGETSYSRRAVIGALAILTGDGWWSIGPRAGRPRGSNNEYKLIIPPWIDDLLPGRPDGKDEFEHELLLAAKRAKYAAKQIASGLPGNGLASATASVAAVGACDVSAAKAHGVLPEGSAKGIGYPSPDLGPCANNDPDHVQTIAGPCANSAPVLAGQGPPTSLKNNPIKEQASSCAVDADASTLRDDADASPSDTDDQPSPKRKTSGQRIVRRRRPLSIAVAAVEQADLSDDEADDVLGSLADEVNGAAYAWALKRTCQEKRRAVAATHLLIPAALWPRVLAWGLMWARNQPRVPESLADALGGFSWAPETYSGERRQKEPVECEQLPRVRYYEKKPGVADETVHEEMWAAVERLSAAELEAKVDHFRRYRTKLWRECEESARKQHARDAGHFTEVQTKKLALKFAIQHYGGRFPMFVVPYHAPEAA